MRTVVSTLFLAGLILVSGSFTMAGRRDGRRHARAPRRDGAVGRHLGLPEPAAGPAPRTQRSSRTGRSCTAISPTYIMYYSRLMTWSRSR
jgi:hypothetical protein